MVPSTRYITVWVEYDNLREQIGRERELKKEFFKLDKLMAQISTQFEGVIPSSYIFKLYRKERDSTTMTRISNDQVLQETIERTRTKDIILYARKVGEVDVRKLQAENAVLKGEAVALKEEIRSLKAEVIELKGQLEDLRQPIDLKDLIEKGEIEGIPELEPSTSGCTGAGGDIKKEEVDFLLEDELTGAVSYVDTKMCLCEDWRNNI